MYLWVVAVLDELDSYPDNNKGPDNAHFTCQKIHLTDPSHTTYQTSNPLITRPLSPNCTC